MPYHRDTPRKGIAHITVGSDLDSSSQSISGKLEIDIEFTYKNSVCDLLSLIETQDHIILLNLSNVTYADSAGLWFFFELHKKITNEGQKFALINVQKDIQRALDITKLSSKIKSFRSVASALKALPSERDHQ